MAYAAPEPEGLKTAKVLPAASLAQWNRGDLEQS